jgi:CMP-N-acetylneuraminic acid synthetase
VKDKLKTVLTVRKGSVRVKNKNFKPFNKKNLLSYKIEILKKVKGIGEIIVNTDSDEAIKIAKDYGVSVHKRDPYFASSKCGNSEFWAHIAEVTDSEYILFTHCTNPLITNTTYKDILQAFDANKNNFDSFNTVTEVKEFLLLDKKPINFELDRAPNSQDLPDMIKLNFAINILSTELMKNKKSLIGNKPFFFKLDQTESFDINTNHDFEVAEILHKKNLNI